MQHADGQTPLSAERRTPSPEREAAISLAAGARARSAHAIGADREKAVSKKENDMKSQSLTLVLS